MASKSKDVRIEQLRIFEKKLALRLQQLDQKGIGKEKAQNDPLVKSLKSKIRETNVRIAAFEKFVKLTQALAQAKTQKLAELAVKKEEKLKPAPAKEPAAEAKQAEPKAKKKAVETDKEPKKQPAEKEEPAKETPKKEAAAEEAAPKKPKKPAASADESAPKKTKKQPDTADETAPKKRATKKKEE
jgi:hypothetical protein